LQFKKTFIDGLILIKPDIFNDGRGYFFESYNKNKYADGGIDQVFVQDNISKSIKNTVRGLHYQVGEFAQGKLCSAVAGKVFDIAVDIRFGSPTFGKYFAVELSEENKYQLWIPYGFAHGFSVLSDDTIFSYKCTTVYNKQYERSILYNDLDLKIDWKVKKPIISEKDLQAIKFKEIEKDFIYSSSRR